MVGTKIMQKQTHIDSLGVESVKQSRREPLNVAEWLSDIESALESEDVRPDREYTNIGGQNGLELFV